MIQSEIFDLLFPIKSNMPEKLYHYTNIESAYAMMKNKSLWLTNSKYMNDPTEMSAIIKHIVDIIRDGVWKSKELRDFQNAINDFEYDSMISDENPQEFELADSEAFIFSLSSDGDSLEQWRAYAPGKYGVCIEFDAHALSGC